MTEAERAPPVTQAPRLCSVRTTPTACAHGTGSAGGIAALCGALCVRIMRASGVHHARKRCAVIRVLHYGYVRIFAAWHYVLHNSLHNLILSYLLWLMFVKRDLNRG